MWEKKRRDEMETLRQRMRREGQGPRGNVDMETPFRAVEGAGLLAAAETVSAAPLISLLPDVQIRCQCQRSP